MMSFLEALDAHFRVVALLAIVGLLAICTIGRILRCAWTAHCRERSRRDIAAWVAEGGIPPEIAERILRVRIDRDTSMPG